MEIGPNSVVYKAKAISPMASRLMFPSYAESIKRHSRGNIVERVAHMLERSFRIVFDFLCAIRESSEVVPSQYVGLGRCSQYKHRVGEWKDGGGAGYLVSATCSK